MQREAREHNEVLMRDMQAQVDQYKAMSSDSKASDMQQIASLNA